MTKAIDQINHSGKNGICFTSSSVEQSERIMVRDNEAPAIGITNAPQLSFLTTDKTAIIIIVEPHYYYLREVVENLLSDR